MEITDEVTERINQQKLKYKKQLEDYYISTMETIKKNFEDSNQTIVKAKEAVKKLQTMTMGAWEDYLETLYQQIGRPVENLSIVLELDELVDTDWLDLKTIPEQLEVFVQQNVDVPMEVNPKQYLRILKRREERKRLIILKDGEKKPDESVQSNSLDMETNGLLHPVIDDPFAGEIF